MPRSILRLKINSRPAPYFQQTPCWTCNTRSIKGGKGRAKCKKLEARLGEQDKQEKKDEEMRK